MKYIPSNTIRQTFILAIIILLLVLIFKETIPYLPGILGAFTFYVILKKPMAWLVARNWHPYLAVGVLLLASFIAILLPVMAVVLMLSSKLKKVMANSPDIMGTFKKYFQKIGDFIDFDLGAQIDFKAISEWASTHLGGFAGGTFNTLVAIGLMYFMLYYMLVNQRALRECLFDYIPIAKNNLEQIGNAVRQMVLANALGIPLVSIAQGIVALIGFYGFGIENPMFWALIVAIGSMIPFVGSALGTVPVFIISLSQGNTFAAWGMLLYAFIIIGATDNLIRMYVLKKLDNVHPLITLMGILVGIPLFGFIGLIFGPLLISLFLLVVKIYRDQYANGVPSEEEHCATNS